MKKAITISRILLGIMLVVFGLNGFLNFIPMPEHPEAATDFMGAIMTAGYLMPLVKGLEVLIGIGLLANFRSPFLLVLIAPISLNAFLFHLFLDPAGIGGAVMMIGLNAFLLYAYRNHYLSMIQQTPATS